MATQVGNSQSDYIFLLSEKGKRKLVDNFSFIYTLERTFNDTEYWTCENRKTCKGRITLKDGKIASCNNLNNHSHAPEVHRVEYIKASNYARQLAINTDLTTNEIISECFSNLTHESHTMLPKLDSLKRKIRNYKLHRGESEVHPIYAPFNAGFNPDTDVDMNDDITNEASISPLNEGVSISSSILSYTPYAMLLIVFNPIWCEV